MHTITTKINNFLTVENIKQEIMKTTNGNPNSILYGLDGRAVLGVYAIFSILPWIYYDLETLGLFLFLTLILAYLCKVSILIMGLMAFGFITQTFTTTLIVMLFGGNYTAFISLMSLTIKLLNISLLTVSVFTSIDPETLSDVLLRIGLPANICFGVSYGYRILPVLIDEYNSIFNSYRLRGQRSEKKFFGINIVYYYIKLIIKSFYPMILNTAKRVKLTVEALETKGYSRAVKSKKVMTLKFKNMRFKTRDYQFLILSVVSLGGIVAFRMVIL